MTESEITIMKEEIARVVREVVNGKIDKIQTCLNVHNEKHEQDMARVLPIIEAFELSEQTIKGAKKSGKFIMGILAFFTAVGAAWLMAKQVFNL